jgi:uncharacterized protein YyaL (SSP411 family)
VGPREEWVWYLEEEGLFVRTGRGVLAPPDSVPKGGFYSAYLPNKVVAGRAQDNEEAARLALLHADRPAREGTATAYVCVNYACQALTTDPEELKSQLGVA